MTDDELMLAALDRMASTDPVEGFRTTRALQRLHERLEAIHVANARAQGWSWQEIAAALGGTKQAVHKKYNKRS